METFYLIKKLERAAKKSLELVAEEREKQAHGAYFPLDIRHPRVLARETFYKNEYKMLVDVMEQVAAFGEQGDEEDREEVIFFARRLIAEVSYPWIRRRVLDEGHYYEIYRDKDFEPYTKGLVNKQQVLRTSKIEVLGLSGELERELIDELRCKIPMSLRKEYVPRIDDVVKHKDELQNMFKDNWSQKARLINFRLYELGLGEKVPN